MSRQFMVVSIVICLLTGCIDQKGTINQGTKDDIIEVVRGAYSAMPAPTINVPPSQKVDIEDLRNQINASSNNTANQMTGAVNASVSKLADQVKGVEANIGKLLEINNTMTANLNSRVDVGLHASMIANTEFKATLENTIALNSEIKASMQAIANIQNQMSADLKVVNSMSADLKANATAVVGLGNRVENLNQNMQAGRDVNYLPKEAVTLVAYFVGGIVLIASIVAFLMHRSSIEAMKLEATKQADERKKINQLLMRAMAVMPVSGNTDRGLTEGTEFKSLMHDIKNIVS